MAGKPQQAKKTGKASRQGVQKRTHKKWHTVRFRRPDTKKQLREPKYPRRAVQNSSKLDAFSTILQPLASETVLKSIEDHNTLVFLVNIKADKKQIKAAAEKLYDIKVVKVNTLIRPDSLKKAFVKVSPEYEALDIANKIGII